MTHRKKIGLFFSHDENWIGGSYYILNLIHSLNSLPDSQKPELVVYYGKSSDKEIVLHIGYPYVKFESLNVFYTLIERIINKLSRVVLAKNVIEKLPPRHDIDVLFPVLSETPFSRALSPAKKIYWIPDFQEHHLPAFFSDEEIRRRKDNQQQIAQATGHIVFSSQDARNDFQQFYPNHRLTTHILSFSVSHPDYQHLSLPDLWQKYQLTQPYFFSPNQFWQHKNQMVILKALKILKDRGVACTVAFSGKEYDHRNTGYFDSLKAYVQQHQLQDYVRFLGFIDRKEQLKLMQEAQAVIQPSLFEGWSTVVEDCKAMNQFVLLSSLKVHQEQMQENVLFFDPSDAIQLADYMQQIGLHPPAKKDIPYDKGFFARTFLQITDDMRTAGR